MSIQSVTQSIQFILAPVVMITSCAIFLGGLLQRYAAVNDRMRAMARERLALLPATGGGAPVPPAPSVALRNERLREIDYQLPDLLYRHQLLRNAILALHAAVVILVANMFVIFAATLTSVGWVAAGALLVFLAGTGALFVAVLIASIEVRSSHRAVQYEVRRIMGLK